MEPPAEALAKVGPKAGTALGYFVFMEQERNHTAHLKDKLLHSGGFQSAIRTLATYHYGQTPDEEHRSQLKDRIRQLYQVDAPVAENVIPEERELVMFSKAVLGEALVRCERGEFSSEWLVDSFASLRFGEATVAELRIPPPGAKDEVGRVFLNDMVAYLDCGEGEYSLHVVAPDHRPDSVTAKIKEGLELLADKVHRGEVPVKTVLLHSWLLGGKFGQYAKRLLGDDVTIADVTSDESNDVLAAQRIGAQANPQLLRRYLETGALPPVGEVRMTAEELVKRFSRNEVK